MARIRVRLGRLAEDERLIRRPCCAGVWPSEAMAKCADGHRQPDGDRSGDLCRSERQSETGPGWGGQDLWPVYLRERMMRIINRRRLSRVCGGTWSCSADLEFRGLHTRNDNRPGRSTPG